MGSDFDGSESAPPTSDFDWNQNPESPLILAPTKVVVQLQSEVKIPIIILTSRGHIWPISTCTANKRILIQQSPQQPHQHHKHLYLNFQPLDHNRPITNVHISTINYNQPPNDRSHFKFNHNQ